MMIQTASTIRKRATVLLISFLISILPTGVRAGEDVRLTIIPTTSSVDQAVHVRITGLVPLELITLRAQQNRFGFPIASSATFRVSSAGTLDLSKDAPVSGDYVGADQMGLFWSMHLIAKPKFVLSPEPELQPFNVTLSVVRGSAILASSTVRRYVIASTTLHREINSNGLVAAYFAPIDGRTHPGVIVLNGSDGGLQRDTAALLARHGFCALAVAYFGIGKLPRYLSDIPIETVEHAIALLRKTPGVDPSKIGVLGFSKGAELALVSASHFSAIKAVVAYAPSSAIFEGLGPSTKPKSSWTFRGQELPFANGAVPSVVQRKIDGALAARTPVSYTPWYLAKLNGSPPRALISVESIRGPIMLIAGGEDNLWPSAAMETRIATRLKEHHHSYSDELWLYPKAGHAIEVPFVPTPHTISAGVLMLGGTPSANARADVDSWSRVLVFLKTQL